MHSLFHKQLTKKDLLLQNRTAAGGYLYGTKTHKGGIANCFYTESWGIIKR